MEDLIWQAKGMGLGVKFRDLGRRRPVPGSSPAGISSWSADLNPGATSRQVGATDPHLWVFGR